MNLVDVVLAVVKIAVMLGFFLTMAAVSIWADRRQSAMVQDRVGPNRAVFTLPANIVRLIVLAPPIVLAALAVAPAVPTLSFYHALRAPRALELHTLSVQVTILVVWVSLLLLSVAARRTALNAMEASLARANPRGIFYGGVAAHAAGFALSSAVTLDNALGAARVTGVVLAVVLLAAGLYTASRVPDHPVEIRLAGLVHPVADVIKLVIKEDFVPKNADKLMFAIAPMIALFPALVTIAVIPFGAPLCFQGDPSKPLGWSDLGRVVPELGRDGVCGGHAVPLQIADLNVGVLFIFALAGTGVIGAALAGWASDNKYSLLGGLRAASQMISYEVAMGLSLVGLFLVYGSVRMGSMVWWQGENTWGIFVQPFAFILFLTALAAETKRTPFDQPEGESEIVAGYFVEYSGLKFGMFYVGEYVEFFVSSAILVTLFLGGYALPFLHADGIRVALGDATFYEYRMNHTAVVVVSALAFFGKTVLVSWLQIFFRWTLLRFRYDQVMRLGWTKLLPLSLANMMVTGLVVMAVHNAGPGVQSVLKILSDLTQAVVAVGAVAGMVALVVLLLEPVERKKFLQSTAARLAHAAGGTHASPRQA